MLRLSRSITQVGVLGLLALLLLALSFQALTPVDAQDIGPTATPNDPIWRAFSTVRDAVEEGRSVDLTLIKAYDWEQSEWKSGIDDCTAIVTEDPAAARKIYFGWTFTITSLRGEVFQGRVSFDLSAVTVCDQVVTAAAAPTPSGTLDPNLPTPIPGGAVAGGFELGGQALDMNLNTFGLMSRSGMKWVKQQVRYNLGDDPSKAQGQISVAHSNGYKILLSVLGAPDQLASNFDNYVGSFANFAGGVAALGADAIEVWNEPNIDREWPAGQVSGASYTRMLAAAYNAIKGKNPNTIVVSAAPAPTGFFGAAGCTANGCNDDVFMSQMAQAGAGQYVDCIGLHYNEGILAPSASSGDPRGSYPTYYFGSMLNRGYSPFGGKPVCFTELGYLSPEGYPNPLPANFAWGQDTSSAEQASWLAEAATLAAQSGKVRIMIVFNVDYSFYTADDPQGGYAIFRPGGGCPACDSLGAVMRQ
jgi:hypothetical protein